MALFDFLGEPAWTTQGQQPSSNNTGPIMTEDAGPTWGNLLQAAVQYGSAPGSHDPQDMRRINQFVNPAPNATPVTQGESLPEDKPADSTGIWTTLLSFL